jgi:hypothetical protein
VVLESLEVTQWRTRTEKRTVGRWGWLVGGFKGGVEGRTVGVAAHEADPGCFSVEGH